jgi:hypothetical protein
MQNKRDTDFRRYPDKTPHEHPNLTICGNLCALIQTDFLILPVFLKPV